jgi:biotin synthase
MQAVHFYEKPETCLRWDVPDVFSLYHRPFMELIFQAATVHRQYFNPNGVQRSTLLSIKTGGCPEDCGYCPQSIHHATKVEDEPMLDLDDVILAAQAAKKQGATRFCMGAAWRGPNPRDLDVVCSMIEAVKAEGLQTCVTLGLLKEGMAERLKQSGLDYYNHNVDTSPEYYQDIIRTRHVDDRLDTLAKVRRAGLSMCCGGIIGMNESREDRAAMLTLLANMDPPPESVPINQLVKVQGTELEDAEVLDWTEFVRTIAVARIVMPKSRIRLSAGRSSMSEEMQALCFMAGANSMFYGETLLTTDNPSLLRDRELFAKLDLVGE